MTRKSTGLRRLAITVWLAWIGLLALLGGLLATRTWRPPVVVVAPPLVLMIAAGLALVVAVVQRLYRGSERTRALAWLLVGIAPFCFIGAHLMYGRRAVTSREFGNSVLLNILTPLGGSVMDLEAWFRYSQRTAGEKVVMISARTADARAQVAAMDRHVRKLEARLGGRTTWYVTWVRGPLLGMEGRACFDVALGIRHGTHGVDHEGLTSIDRHEVAHCVITRFHSPWSYPPTLLVEGWAEANSEMDEAQLALRAWQFRDQAQALSLAELCGPEWYGRDKWPVYVQGGPLVNFLLRRFGPERFLALYTTAQRATVASDFQRILGMSLDELDSAYWADVERLVPPADRSLQGGLARLELGPGVDPAKWKAFVADYGAAYERLMKPYEHVRIKVDWSHSGTKPDGQVSSLHLGIDLVRSGDYCSVRLISPGGFGQVYLAHPRRSLNATRHGEGTWVVEDDPTLGPGRLYRRTMRRIEDLWLPFLTVPSLGSALSHRVQNRGLVVEDLSRFTEDGHRYVRVCLNDHVPSEAGMERLLTFILSADHLYALRSLRSEYGKGSSDETIGYEIRDGIPLMTSFERRDDQKDGTHTSLRLTVAERSFEATPESEFSADKLLTGTIVHEPVNGTSPYAEAATIADWYWLPLGCGAFSLAGGAGLSSLPGRRRRPREEPASGDAVSGSGGRETECSSPTS